MLYILLLVIVNVYFGVVYYKSKLQPISEKHDDIDPIFNGYENVPVTNEVEPYSAISIMWTNLCIVALVFIIGIIVKAGTTEMEYKNADVTLANNQIQTNGLWYNLYVDNELVSIKKSSLVVVVEQGITSPYITNYYSRKVQEPIKSFRLFFFYNRKYKRTTEWSNISGCNCSCSNERKLVLDKEYPIKDISK